MTIEDIKENCPIKRSEALKYMEHFVACGELSTGKAAELLGIGLAEFVGYMTEIGGNMGDEIGKAQLFPQITADIATGATPLLIPNCGPCRDYEKEAWIAFAAAAYPQMAGSKTVASIADTMLAHFKKRFPK